MAMFDSGTFDTSAFGPDIRVMSQVGGQSPKAALGCGVWPVSQGGDDHYYANTILPNGLMVTDPTSQAALVALLIDISGYLADIAAAPPVTRPTATRIFTQTPNGATTGALVICPASLDGKGKVIINESTVGGADGVDMWVGPNKPDGVNVLTTDGYYLSPDSSVSISGQGVVYVYATAPGGICRCLEEY